VAPVSRISLASLARRGAVYAIKVANLGAGVLVSLLLARIGGPEVLGSYSLAIQTAQLASILAILGCDQLILREVAGRLRLGDRPGAASAIGHYSRFVLPFGLAVTLAFAGAVKALALAGVTVAADPALLAATGFVAANVLYALGLGAVRGLGNPVWAQLFDGLFTVPLALVLAVLLATGNSISTAGAVVLATGLLLATMLGLGLTVTRTIGGWGRDAAAAFPSPWVAGAPMMATSFLLFFLQWLPLFLAGALGSAADAGTFRAAWQLAFPLAVVQATTVSAISAQVAGDLSEGRLDQAARRIQRNRLGVLAITLPLAVPLLIWPDQIMGLLFGPAFVGNGLIVRGLVAINLGMIAAGPLAAVITMAGRNRDTLPWGAASAVLLLALSLWLMPMMGVAGLVIAYGGAVLLRTISFWRLTRAILHPPA
jgi:O-antigen/teichoic acid export membrane protein